MTKRFRFASVITVTMLVALLCAGQGFQGEQDAISSGTPTSKPEPDPGFSSAVIDPGTASDPRQNAAPAATLLSQQMVSSGVAATPSVTPPASGATQTPGFPPRYPRYVLRAADVFELTFEYTPEFNQTITVQPDGFVTLREVGDVHVQGLTTEQVTAVIQHAYAKILHDPSIAIMPRLFEQPYIVVGGEVKSPGKFELRGTTTVAQAVALAGGFTEAAKHSHVLLFRRQSAEGTMEVKSINVKRMIKDENLVEDAELRPGDMIYVPQNMLSKVKGFIVPRAAIALRPPTP